MNVKSRKNIIEIIMFLSYAVFAVLWIAGSGFTPQIMEHFGIKTFSSATFISNAITFAKIVGNLCAATILVKLYPKKAIALASFLIVFGSILAVFAPSFIIFIIGRFIMGFGGALFIVYFSPVVINYFDPKDRIVLNGINGSAYNAGSIFAMFMITPIFVSISSMNLMIAPWQSTLLLFSLVSAILLLCWLLFGEDFELKSNKAGVTKQEYTFKQALKERFNYVFPFCYSGVISLYIVVLTIYPNFKGASIDTKLLSAILALSGIAGAIIGIVFAKKLKKRLPIIFISGILMSVFSYFLFTTTNQVLAVISAIMVGFLMFLPNASMLIIPQELPNTTPAKITVIMGMFFSIAYIIQMIQYYICGIIIDKAGISGALLFTAIFSLTLPIGAIFLPETGKTK